jgi:peptidyl-prolyl cis-trans isomerase SurA
MPRSSRPLALCLALATASTSALVARPSVAHAEIVDRVVALIEDDAIFLSELERRLRPFEAQLQQMQNPRERAQRREQLYRETLERMVDDALIRRAAQRAHISVTEADVDRMIQGIAQQRGASVQDIYQALESEGLTRSEYRQFMEAEVLRLRVLNVRVRGRVNITDTDIAEEYRNRVREANARAPFHIAHIFVAFPQNPSAAQVVAAQRRAEEIVRRLRAGEEFATVAQSSSDDTASRGHGGDLGTVDPEDPEQPAPDWLVHAVRDLQPGQFSNAVRGANGYHVFRLIERQTIEVPTLSAVRSDLYNELLNREMARQQRIYLRELRQRSSVEIRL